MCEISTRTLARSAEHTNEMAAPHVSFVHNYIPFEHVPCDQATNDGVDTVCGSQYNHTHIHTTETTHTNNAS